MQQSRPAVLATVVTACALLTACAGSAGSATTVDTAPAPQQIMTASGQSIRLGTTSSIVAVSEAIRIGTDSAYGLLLKVYGDLQIPTTMLDSRQHTAGNPALKIRRRLSGVSLVKYLDCGHEDGNPNADSYDVVLHVVTAVSGAAEGSSVLSTRVDGVATHPVFGSQAVCSTTGELEKRIAAAVKEKSAAKWFQDNWLSVYRRVSTARERALAAPGLLPVCIMPAHAHGVRTAIFVHVSTVPCVKVSR